MTESHDLKNLFSANVAAVKSKRVVYEEAKSALLALGGLIRLSHKKWEEYMVTNPTSFVSKRFEGAYAAKNLPMYKCAEISNSELDGKLHIDGLDIIFKLKNDTKILLHELEGLEAAGAVISRDIRRCELLDVGDISNDFEVIELKVDIGGRHGMYDVSDVRSSVGSYSAINIESDMRLTIEWTTFQHDGIKLVNQQDYYYITSEKPHGLSGPDIVGEWKHDPNMNGIVEDFVAVSNDDKYLDLYPNQGIFLTSQVQAYINRLSELYD